ncbi:MAG: hypothetical protein PHX76_00095 [Patescibacteria group bacterium]|jgi:hypothetical protein|nr:hypothetical protein [Patescibacteria group bacterium]MDD4443646.1 hypothetical protein [Patescibacteria group bacterium]NCU39284.1 hypothetical protein [Candidatus Falkowbacteria bacterium]
MKNKKLKSSLLILGSFAFLFGGAIIADAANQSNRGGMFGLSEEEKIEKIAERDERRGANYMTREVNRDIMQTALKSRDYNSWKEALPEDHFLADKITAENFATFLEAHDLMEQAHNKFLEIGIDNQGQGMMSGRGMGGLSKMK